MTRHSLEERLRSVPHPDESVFVARPLPASPGPGARTLRSSALGMGASLTVVAAAVVAVVVLGSLGGWVPRGPEPGSGGGASSPPATAVLTPAEGVPDCGAAELSLRPEPWGGAAGSRGTVLRVALPSDATCRLSGPVAVQIVDGAGSIVVRGVSADARSVTLGAGSTGQVGISWSNWCDPVPASALGWSVRFGAGPWREVVEQPGAIPVPPCLGSGGSSLSVTSLEPGL